MVGAFLGIYGEIVEGRGVIRGVKEIFGNQA